MKLIFDLGSPFCPSGILLLKNSEVLMVKTGVHLGHVFVVDDQDAAVVSEIKRKLEGYFYKLFLPH